MGEASPCQIGSSPVPRKLTSALCIFCTLWLLSILSTYLHLLTILSTSSSLSHSSLTSTFTYLYLHLPPPSLTSIFTYLHLSPTPLNCTLSSFPLLVAKIKPHKVRKGLSNHFLAAWINVSLSTATCKQSKFGVRTQKSRTQTTKQR